MLSVLGVWFGPRQNIRLDSHHYRWQPATDVTIAGNCSALSLHWKGIRSNSIYNLWTTLFVICVTKCSGRSILLTIIEVYTTEGKNNYIGIKFWVLYLVRPPLLWCNICVLFCQAVDNHYDHCKVNVFLERVM